MTFLRGQIWIANLNPTLGSEQAGIRPVLICQKDGVNQFTTTLLVIPFTTNLRRASLPSCVLILKEDSGLPGDSVALCHQLRAIDKIRLVRMVGSLDDRFMPTIESCLLYTLGIL